jgi:hypothetical protein
MSEAKSQKSERRFRVVSISADGERLVYANGLDIIEAYECRRRIGTLGDKHTPPPVIETEEHP